MADKYYVYILRCKDNSYYTGYTTDVNRRLREHNIGEGAKYTRSRRPCVVVYHRSFNSRSEAMKEECRIKKLSRKEKIELIKEGNLSYITNYNNVRHSLENLT